MNKFCSGLEHGKFVIRYLSFLTKTFISRSFIEEEKKTLISHFYKLLHLTHDLMTRSYLSKFLHFAT